MRRVYACELGEGDTIVIPPSLVISKAKIKGLTAVPTRQGDMIIVDVESNGGLWSPSKARFAFHANEKVESKPFKLPLKTRLWDRLCAFVRFFDFTR